MRKTASVFQRNIADEWVNLPEVAAVHRVFDNTNGLQLENIAEGESIVDWTNQRLITKINGKFCQQFTSKDGAVFYKGIDIKVPIKITPTNPQMISDGYTVQNIAETIPIQIAEAIASLNINETESLPSTIGNIYHIPILLSAAAVAVGSKNAGTIANNATMKKMYLKITTPFTAGTTIDSIILGGVTIYPFSDLPVIDLSLVRYDEITLMAMTSVESTLVINYSGSPVVGVGYILFEYTVGEYSL